MGRIYCIMGKSSSGKDTIYKKLVEDPKLSLKRIVPYTTRPMRAGERDGVEYYFCSEEKLRELSDAGKVIELRAYDTVQGEWVGLDEGGYLYLDLDTMDYSYAPDDKVDLEHGYALLYEVEAFDNDDGTTQYGYQVDLYPNWDDYGYSMYLSASNDGGSILVTMKYDDIGYPDGNTLRSWSRPGAQDI